MLINEWLVFSLLFLLVWFIIYFLKPLLKKEMLLASILTAPFGLTEPLFVPEYWNPPSLFNLAARTGFDIESLIFCFAIGGVGSILYQGFFNLKHKKMSKKEMHSKRHRFHLLALFSPVIIFIPLYLLTALNPIYTASIAMFIGALAAILCRPDLKKNIWISGLMFLSIYFIFFLLFNLTYPEMVQQVWNLAAISGILITGIPLEELVFAFTFGMLWSSIYEHINWYKLKSKKIIRR